MFHFQVLIDLFEYLNFNFPFFSFSFFFEAKFRDALSNQVVLNELLWIYLLIYCMHNAYRPLTHFDQNCSLNQIHTTKIFKYTEVKRWYAEIYFVSIFQKVFCLSHYLTKPKHVFIMLSQLDPEKLIFHTN